MARFAPIAAWGGLAVSLITLTLVGSMLSRDPAGELSDLRDATQKITQLLEGGPSLGSTVPGGLIGDVNALSSQLADLAASLGSMQDSVAEAADASNLAADQIADVRSELDSVSAKLSDICFRLGSC